MCCSAEFLSWFFLQVTGRKPAHLKLLAAKHSVVGSLGQTDIEVTVAEDAGREVVFLIENKVGKTKQPTQSERYEERKRDLYSGRECHVVLVVPKRCATPSFVAGYESVLLLEKILKWFQGKEPDGSRRDFKLAQLEQALSPVAPPRDKAFRKNYWAVSQGDEFRNLGMLEGGGNIYFYPEELPAGIRFVHKLIRGRVEIIFRGRRNDFVALRNAVEQLPDHEFEVHTYKQSTFISAEVPPLVKEMNFEPQKEKVVEGLRAAVKLWAWFRENKDTIMSAVL
jgi:hypothetical protein